VSVISARGPASVSLLHVEVGGDGAYDAVLEVLVDPLLERRAVDRQHLAEAVDGRILRRYLRQRAPRRYLLQGRGRLLRPVRSSATFRAVPASKGCWPSRAAVVHARSVLPSSSEISVKLNPFRRQASGIFSVTSGRFVRIPPASRCRARRRTSAPGREQRRREKKGRSRNIGSAPGCAARAGAVFSSG
jgi:hypothetical protein